MAGCVKVPLRPGSDGDATHRPKDPARKESSPALYLEKIGQLWMKARGEARPGIEYELERLPAGYAVYERARPTKPSHVDKWLYGHPEHKTFDSPNRFFKHFQHLMENNGSNIGCPCDVCNSAERRRPSLGSVSASSTSTSSRASKVPKSLDGFRFEAANKAKANEPQASDAGLNSRRVDEEGTPDVYRNLIDKLKVNGTLDELITEPLSPDWRAQQEILPTTLKRLKNNPQWLPRHGEIVLYVKDIPTGFEICWTPSGEVMLYNPMTKAYDGHPMWEAGFVAQTPIEASKLEDLITETEKEMNVSYSGIRVEQIPNVNGFDRSLSKRAYYVPIHRVRPFAFWKEFLNNVPASHWHHTVTNALTLTATLSLMGSYRFRGTWPSAQIYAHGIYVGPELFSVGDTVRLLPRAGDPTCTQVMIITSIRLKLASLDLASDNDWDEGRPYNLSISVYGRAYTSDSSRSDKQWITPDYQDNFTPVLRSYGEWYPLHSSTQEMTVPFTRLFSRFYEAPAMSLWFPHIQCPTIDLGRVGAQEARAYAQANDHRINNDPIGANWYWADTRVQALGLQTVSGSDVGKYNEERDLKHWREMIKALNKFDAIAKENAMKHINPDSDTKMINTTDEEHEGNRRAHGSPSEEEVARLNLEAEILRSTKIIDDTHKRKRQRGEVRIIID
ncbi:hypothetical protein BU24DRAFT_420932, partial [Aaosphaeria arxii CBS 175.79]